MGLPTSDTSVKESSLRHADKFIELRRNQLSDEIDAQLEIIDTLLLAHVLHGGALSDPIRIPYGGELSDPIRIPLDKDLAYFIGLTLTHKGYYVRYSHLDTKTVLSIQIRA